MILGVDASNIRRGGGLTHLVEFIRNVELRENDRVYIWAPASTLAALPERSWLTKLELPDGYRGIRRLYWQTATLRREAEQLSCDVVFVPGSSYLGSFRPFVTLSQNLLPFQTQELLRFGLSFMTVKLLILRAAQSLTFKNAGGVIFLTKFARDTVEMVLGGKLTKSAVIPHGVGEIFIASAHNPSEAVKTGINILYVSTIDQYKHQWNVVKAVAMLRDSGINATLTLAGPAYGPALRRLNKAIERHDPHQEWVDYIGATRYEQLPALYNSADIGLFASTCENLPIILLEMMASGMAICSSNSGPMPEVLGNGGLYFDATDPGSIATAIRTYLEEEALGLRKRDIARRRAKEFTWNSAAQATVEFIRASTPKHPTNGTSSAP